MTKKLVLAAITASAASTAVAESSVSLDASLGFTSRYVWRGLTFANESAQGDLSLGIDAGEAGSFSLGIWGQLDLTDDYDEELNFTEVDLYGGWEKSFDMVTVGAGVINYQFPSINKDAATTELYASIGIDTFLAPSLTVYYDVDAADGDAVYASFGIGHDFDLDFTTLSVGGAVGYVNEDGGAWLYGSDDSGFTDIALSASMSFDLSESISVSPFIMYTALIEDAKDANGGDNEEIFGGVNFSMSF